MIRKVYEVDPMLCPQCGGTTKVIAFITDFSVVDRIIDHMKLTFVAERPPPMHLAYQEVLVAAEAIETVFGSFVRSAYTRLGMSTHTHTPTDRDEVLRVRDWVRIVLCELPSIQS